MSSAARDASVLDGLDEVFELVNVSRTTRFDRGLSYVVKHGTSASPVAGVVD
jgi:hypothetical protein